MPFGPVDPQLDLVALERRVQTRWRERDVIAAVADLRKGAEPWIFYEGPPTANGRPGLHHVWARAFKDLYPRFQTMRGKSVPRKGGWDCHGLPVEIEVEKALGLSSKDQIEAYGVAAFNEQCRASVHRYVEDWSALTARSGVWIDTADAYWTLTNDYVESVWWLVKQMWDKGLVYEGHRVTPYCGRCGTALSSHEVAQGYADITDTSVYVRFPLLSGPMAGADLLVWTTTPWTLPSNVACAVSATATYARVTVPGGADLVMAEALAGPYLDGGQVVATCAGADLVGSTYQRPFDDLPLTGGYEPRVVTGEFVTTDADHGAGSGIVHMAPAFGEDDAAVGRAERLPTLNPVDADAAFDDSIPRLNGTFVRDADPRLIAELTERGLLVQAVPYEHSYPHCWRCSTPLIYWAKTSWFARTSDLRPELMAQNDQIGWHPEHIKHGRFGNWLEHNIDWALSRDRYWGTPLPVWRCSSCSTDTCIGSVAELAALAGRDLDDLDLHRPYVDDVTFACPSCPTGTARRVTSVLDAWFDSGSMPSAQHHYPFENETLFEQSFPADFICEAIDQTRGWFYSLLAVNTLVFGQSPYRDVVCLAHIVDGDGQKMSKSKGNVIDPFEIMDRFGADGLRWYFFSSGQPWINRRVFDDAIREATGRTLVTLWNVVSFFATYADLDGFDPASDAGTDAPTHVLDRWVLSELDETVAGVTAALEGFDAFAAADRIARFVDDLSNWYVRRSRPRFWKDADPVAHRTLHTCLVTTAQLLAPLCPFVADEIHTLLTGHESVHLTDWPAATGAHDPALAVAMAGARRLVGLGRAARTESKVKVRQPLRTALMLHPGLDLPSDVAAQVADELNVKTLEAVSNLSDVLSWEVVPNFRALGQRLGPKLPALKAALAAADGSALQAQLAAEGAIEVEGERLSADDVVLRAVSHERFALSQDDTWAVALDLDLDESLRVEGTARELVRALNDLRKARGLAIADHVTVVLDASPGSPVAEAVAAHGDEIAREVLAESLTVGPVTGPDSGLVDVGFGPCGVAITNG